MPWASGWTRCRAETRIRDLLAILVDALSSSQEIEDALRAGKGHSLFGHQREAAPQPFVGVEAGQVLGDFNLIKLIGQGGMGQVWDAQQLSLKRQGYVIP